MIMTKRLTACPHCGGELQATMFTESWLTFRDGKWTRVGRSASEVYFRFYCENDHDISPDSASRPPDDVSILVEGADHAYPPPLKGTVGSGHFA